MYTQQFGPPPSHMAQRGYPGAPMQEPGFHPMSGQMGPRPGYPMMRMQTRPGLRPTGVVPNQPNTLRLQLQHRLQSQQVWFCWFWDIISVSDKLKLSVFCIYKKKFLLFGIVFLMHIVSLCRTRCCSIGPWSNWSYQGIFLSLLVAKLSIYQNCLLSSVWLNWKIGLCLVFPWIWHFGRIYVKTKKNIWEVRSVCKSVGLECIYSHIKSAVKNVVSFAIHFSNASIYLL